MVPTRLWSGCFERRTLRIRQVSLPLFQPRIVDLTSYWLSEPRKEGVLRSQEWAERKGAFQRKKLEKRPFKDAQGLVLLPPSAWANGLTGEKFSLRSKCSPDITGHWLFVQIPPKSWYKSLARKERGAIRNWDFRFGRILSCKEWVIHSSLYWPR